MTTLSLTQVLGGLFMFILGWAGKKLLDKYALVWISSSASFARSLFARKVLVPIATAMQEDERLKELLGADPSLRPTVMAAATYHLVHGAFIILFLAGPFFLVAGFSPQITGQPDYWGREICFWMSIVFICIGFNSIIRGRWLRYLAGKGIVEKNLEEKETPQ